MNKSNIEFLKEQTTREPIARYFGIQLLDLKDGYARVSFRIKPEHINFHQRPFGGIVMCVADAAFGYAVNSINYPTVAAQFDIQFLSSPEIDDVLIAEGKVLKIGRRAAFCEMIVTNQHDKLIARASGTGIPLAESKKANQ